MTTGLQMKADVQRQVAEWRASYTPKPRGVNAHRQKTDTLKNTYARARDPEPPALQPIMTPPPDTGMDAYLRRIQERQALLAAMPPKPWWE